MSEYCTLCQIGLSGSESPIDILKSHYRLSHPEADQWPKDENGLPILKGYYKQSTEPAIVDMIEEVEAQPEPPEEQ